MVTNYVVTDCTIKIILWWMALWFYRCDSKRVKNAALSLLPVIGWIKLYHIKEWMLGDIVSGVSTGLVAVLQGKTMFN